ncbi:MAG TPA: gliding motility-associated C-terminal domain-containing protein [Bacteroidales bacterium]|nr:gliding motility-associated C-terminal domain-containing protein [Bacteroidales bacterium]
MAVSLSNLCKKQIFILLIISIFSVGGFAQTQLSGDIGTIVKNSKKIYSSTAVKTIDAGLDRVTVNDIADFNVNDTVLVIQMQGVGITVSPFGRYQTSFGKPGLHEFMIIEEVNAPDEIVFRSQLRNAYDVAGKVQVVRVPYFNSAVVTGNLTVQPWNPVTGKGGVIALIIGRSIALNADIDVTGRGFNGGPASIGSGDCSPTDQFYPSSFTGAGYKGEGLAIHDEFKNLLIPNYTKGKSPNYTGGGGGNGRYSGGGGGAHRGEGGRGGYEDPTCAPPDPGGEKSWTTGIDLPGRILFGGGGGASTSASGTLGAGGNGGGIVILITDSISSGGGRILANGGNGADGGSNGGAGGGGAGGTIALNFTKTGSANINLAVNGGNGGNNTSFFGEGGGGGGGFIFLNKTAPSSLITQYAYGQAGNYPSNDAGDQGTQGQKAENFSPVLNGFLFNSIRSVVTENQVDSICFGSTPPKITGTNPVGGITPYSYKWQRRTNLDPWTDIPGATMPDYQPVVETDPAIDTIYFRRIVSDATPVTPLVDYSKRVVIIVQPLLTGNTTSADQIICFNQTPVELVSSGVLAGGNGRFFYTWKLSTDNGSSYNLPANDNSKEKYSPLALTQGTWFRRVVVSGRCIDQGNVVKVTVLDTIKSNRIINLPADICFGSTFDVVNGSSTSTAVTLAGGDGAYRYKWQGSINGSAWADAPGTNNQVNYDVTELSERMPYNEYIFRRVVYSGALDVCSSTSNAILIKDFPVLTNNTITADQAVCSGIAPSQLSGSTPQNGNGTYKYTWEKSSTATGPWVEIPGFVNSDAKNYNPPALTADTWYRRTVLSSACTNTSNSVKITVHQPVTNNNIMLLSGAADTTICKDQVPNGLKGLLPGGGTGVPGDYTYQWLFSTDNSNYNPVPAGGSSLNYVPAALAATTYYKRRVTSGMCTNTSSAVVINVLPLISNNIIASDQVICINTAPAALTGNALAGGNNVYTYKWYQKEGAGTWVEAAGNNTASSYAPSALLSPVKYRRVVYSGNSCSDISNEVNITMHPALPTGTIKNLLDTTICAGSKVQLKVNLTGSGPWNVTYKQDGVSGSVKNSTTSSMVIDVIPTISASSQNFLYTLGKVTDANGCDAPLLTGSKHATVYKVPVAQVEQDKSVCGPAADIAATASVGTGQWTFPSFVVTPAGTNPAVRAVIDTTVLSYKTTGKITGRFSWEETNWQCKSSDFVDITFYRQPDHINAGKDTLLHTMDQVFHIEADSPKAWETPVWSTITGSGVVDGSNITGLSNGLNTFKYKIFNFIETCFLEDVLNIDVTDIEIPEGFSPNNDPGGYNNTFVVKGLNLIDQVAELKIVNSAGAEVFRTSNTDGETWTDWDGRDSHGNELPEGTYYYLLKIRSLNTDKVDPRSGYIILKRY